MSLEKLISNFKKQKQAFVKEVSVEFLTELKKLSKEIEGLEAIQWQQYTPYFNDGDACTFRVSGPTFKFSESEEDAGDYEDGFEDLWSINYNRGKKNLKEHPQTKQLEVISEMIEDDAMEEILLDLYGDHMEITFIVKTGKIEAEEYSHD